MFLLISLNLFHILFVAKTQSNYFLVFLKFELFPFVFLKGFNLSIHLISFTQFIENFIN